MNKKNSIYKAERLDSSLPIHSLENQLKLIDILPLDHQNPYDFKRKHRHSYYELILVEKGGCNQLIDFINYEGYDYSCYIISPQQVHLMNRRNAKGIVVQFAEEAIHSADLLSALKQTAFNPNAAIVFENQNELFNDCASLIHIISKHLREGKINTRRSSSHLLLALISIIVDVMNSSGEERDFDKKLLIDFYQLLEQHFSSGKGVHFYIEKLGTNEKKLARLTKKHLGMSPLQVIHNRLFLEAKRFLLFENTSHKEIAYKLGFDSPASFSAFIKLKSGYSPTEFASQLAEIHK